MEGMLQRHRRAPRSTASKSAQCRRAATSGSGTRCSQQPTSLQQKAFATWGVQARDTLSASGLPPLQKPTSGWEDLQSLSRSIQPHHPLLLLRPHRNRTTRRLGYPCSSTLSEATRGRCTAGGLWATCCLQGWPTPLDHSQTMLESFCLDCRCC